MTPDLTPLPAKTFDRCPLCGKTHTPDEELPADDVPLSWLAIFAVVVAAGVLVAVVSLSKTLGFRL